MKPDTDTDNSFSGAVPTVFRSRAERPPFSDSQTATKAPKPGVPRRPHEDRGFEVAASQTPLFNKIKQKIAGRKTIEETFAEQHERVEAERQRQRELADRLSVLTADAERAQARLARADAEFADLKERFANYTAKLKTMWGQEPNAFTGQTLPIEQHYADFAACERALADFPEARKPLVAAVKEAEAALAKFRKDNDLAED